MQIKKTAYYKNTIKCNKELEEMCKVMGRISILMFEGLNNKKQYTISFNIVKVSKPFKVIFNSIIEKFKEIKFNDKETFQDLLTQNTVQEKTLGSSKKYA